VSGELLLEVRTEEIPARMLSGAAKELATRVFEVLMARGVPPREVEAGFTPRRLWLILKGLPEKEEDRRVVEVGPPVSVAFDGEGRPTKAGEGFARKFGVEVSELGRRDFSGEPGAATKGERVVLEREVGGEPTADILRDLLPSALVGLSWAKTMRWGSGVGPWVRPVHGVVALLDGEVLDFELFDVASGRTTVGHPTLSPESFDVDSAEAWRAALAERGIEPSADRREERLRSGMVAAAEAAGGTLVDDPALLAKLAAICEIPGVLEGRLDDALLGLPREVLVTSLRDHQSALTVEKDGALLPLFLTVMDRPDDPKGRVRAGNEWVVAARLADAVFFWDKDRKVRLEERKAALDGLAFHRDLGSYSEKGTRLVALASELAAQAGLEADESKALLRAASLAKFDLVTEMVREFTDLQGVMGGIYAREQGESEAVWSAVSDQYLPASADDELPRRRVGRLLALADRLDTLVGFFALGSVPTGSKDPFGLRRAATGAVRLLLEEPGIDLPAACASAHGGYAVGLTKSADEAWALLRPFFEDRTRHLFELEGFAYDEIEAALRRPGETLASVAETRARVEALHEARREEGFVAVAQAAKRIENITRDQPACELHAERLALDAETALFEALTRFSEARRSALEEGSFVAGLRAVGALAPTLERFFDEVMVLDPDPEKRSNRLALLQRLGAEIGELADLSQLVIERTS